jgi:hypothetical protein
MACPNIRSVRRAHTASTQPIADLVQTISEPWRELKPHPTQRAHARHPPCRSLPAGDGIRIRRHLQDGRAGQHGHRTAVLPRLDRSDRRRLCTMRSTEKCTAEGVRCAPQATYGNIAKADHPINCVDWTQAVAYCKAWASASLPRKNGNGRLVDNGRRANVTRARRNYAGLWQQASMLCPSGSSTKAP